MRYLVTGAAGFIGFHLTNLLLEHDHDVVGIDNLNDYYDVSLKESRLNLLKSQKNFTFINTDIAYKDEILKIFNTHHFDIVINLAAQAGVRYSISNPYAYIDSNINGFLNILEGCRSNKVSHLLFASSSSVYGLNSQLPFKEFHSTDHPVALMELLKNLMRCLLMLTLIFMAYLQLGLDFLQYMDHTVDRIWLYLNLFTI